MDNVNLHQEYVQKIKRIGEALGFTMEVPRTLGIPDCAWSWQNQHLPRIGKLPKIGNYIPFAVFEVICSEQQKALRGSFTTMLSAKPSLAVFVLIEKGIRKHAEGFKNTSPRQWLKRIKQFISKIQVNFGGNLRIVVWNDRDVNKLYSSLCKKRKVGR